jgi:PAS domain S-box-containing protein
MAWWKEHPAGRWVPHLGHRPVGRRDLVQSGETFTRGVCETAVQRIRRHFESHQVFEYLSNTPEAVCVVDDRQRIVLWNTAAARLVGLAPMEVQGKHCYEVLQSRDEMGCAVCRKNCPAHSAAASGRAVPTRDVVITTKRRGPVRVCAATVVLPDRWLAHLLIDHYPAPDLNRH